MSNFTPSSEYVTDTMGLVLRVESRKMGAEAKTIFEDVEAGKVKLYVPAMVFAEVLYLTQKKQTPTPTCSTRRSRENISGATAFPILF